MPMPLSAPSLGARFALVGATLTMLAVHVAGAEAALAAPSGNRVSARAENKGAERPQGINDSVHARSALDADGSTETRPLHGTHADYHTFPSSRKDPHRDFVENTWGTEITMGTVPSLVSELTVGQGALLMVPSQPSTTMLLITRADGKRVSVMSSNGRRPRVFDSTESDQWRAADAEFPTLYEPDSLVTASATRITDHLTRARHMSAGFAAELIRSGVVPPGRKLRLESNSDSRGPYFFFRSGDTGVIAQQGEPVAQVYNYRDAQEWAKAIEFLPKPDHSVPTGRLL